MAKKRSSLSSASVEFVEKVMLTLNSMKAYWPLTLRQVYYQLVAGLVIENNIKQYQRLSRILTQARLEGRVPWDALEDRSRTILPSRGYIDKSSFVMTEMMYLLQDYRKDMLRSQQVALELWVEKDALSRLCHDVAYDYCVPVIVARGFSSISYVHQCRERVLENYNVRGQRTRILYFGDLDPSGWEMLPVMLDTLQNEMELGGKLEGVRCALKKKQVKKYGLPIDPQALKDSDPRAKRYRELFGDLAVELDALPPDVLSAEVEQAILRNIDQEQLQEDQDTEGVEQIEIQELRRKMREFATSLL